MCDLSGDIETAGLFLDRRVFVSHQGQVSSEPQEGYSEVSGVVQCVGCLARDILPLLSVEEDTLSKFLTTGSHISCNATLLEEASLSKTRKPGMQLVHEGNQLLGVVFNHCGQVQIVGIVSRVVASHSSQPSTVLVVHPQGQIETSNTETFDLDQMALKNNARLVITSLAGNLLLQPVPDSTRLILLLQQTYLVLIDSELTWTRVSSKPEIDASGVVRETRIEPFEIVVCKKGAMLASGAAGHQAMKLLGSGNAVLHYPAFRQSIRCLAIHTNSPWATSS